MARSTIDAKDVKEWFANADDSDIEYLLHDGGLIQVIIDLEQDDFFGTEGFNKRFA